MANRSRFFTRRITFVASMLIFFLMSIVTGFASKVILQFASLGIGDRASLVIATVASCALFISIWQSGYSVRVNNRNNELAMEQRKQSALENKRTYDLTLLQVNRANRLKLYVPLLAWMRGTWYDFDEGVKSIPPQVDEAHPIFETHESNLDKLRQLILTFEFEAEMDLIANKKVQDATWAWKAKIIAAGQLLEELNLKIDLIEDNAEALVEFQAEQSSVKKELERRSLELLYDLKSLEDIIREEIEVPKE